MIINEKKTKSMIINFTNNYQFTTRLILNSTKIEVVDKIKILGTVHSVNLALITTFFQNTSFNYFFILKTKNMASN